MDSFDVAVVGAGIIGSSTALECAVRGARVVLLERGTPLAALEQVNADVRADDALRAIELGPMCQDELAWMRRVGDYIHMH